MEKQLCSLIFESGSAGREQTWTCQTRLAVSGATRLKKYRNQGTPRLSLSHLYIHYLSQFGLRSRHHQRKVSFGSCSAQLFAQSNGISEATNNPTFSVLSAHLVDVFCLDPARACQLSSVYVSPVVSLHHRVDGSSRCSSQAALRRGRPWPHRCCRSCR